MKKQVKDMIMFWDSMRVFVYILMLGTGLVTVLCLFGESPRLLIQYAVALVAGAATAGLYQLQFFIGVRVEELTQLFNTTKEWD